MRRLSVMKAGFVLACALAVFGCEPLIAGYSTEEYKNATSLKVEVEALIDKSSEPFNAHTQDVSELTTKINAAYEFAADMPNNQITATQWDIIRDPNRNLFGGFINEWRSEGTTGAVYRTDKKKQLDEAFNQLICLEVNKDKSTNCQNAVSGSGSSTDSGGKK